MINARTIVEAESAKDFLKRRDLGEKPFKFKVVSSNGELTVNDSGQVLACEMYGEPDPEDNPENGLDKIVKFDMDEWYRSYSRGKAYLRNALKAGWLGTVDILGIGYWLENGRYEPPEVGWRGHHGPQDLG